MGRRPPADGCQLAKQGQQQLPVSEEQFAQYAMIASEPIASEPPEPLGFPREPQQSRWPGPPVGDDGAIRELEASEASVSTEDQVQILVRENGYLRELLQRQGCEELRSSGLRGWAAGEQQAELQELCHLNLHQKLALAQQNEQLRWQLWHLKQRALAMRKHYQLARKSLQEREQTLQQTRKEFEATKNEAQNMAQVHEATLADLRDRNARLAELQIENDCLKTAGAAARSKAQSLEESLRTEIEALKEAGDFQQKVSKDLRKQLGEREEAVERLEQLQEQQAQSLVDLERQTAAQAEQHEQLERDCKEAQQARRWHEQHVSELQQQLASLRASASDAQEKLATVAVEHAEKFGRAAAEQAEKLGRAAAEQAEKLGRAAAEQAAKFGHVATEHGERLGRVAAEKLSLESQLQVAEQRLSQVLQELREASGRAQTAQEALSKAQSELCETRMSASSQIEAMRRQAESECRRLTQKMQAWRARAQEEEEHSAQLLRAEEALRQQRQAAFDSERLELESEVLRLRQELASIRWKLRDRVQSFVSAPEVVVRMAH